MIDAASAMLTRRIRGAAPFFGCVVPKIIAAEGKDAVRCFLEFFTGQIQNKNTRAAYARAVNRFCVWCERRRFTLLLIKPVTVAAYIEELTKTHSKPTAKQHLTAIRMLYDWLPRSRFMVCDAVRRE